MATTAITAAAAAVPVPVPSVATAPMLPALRPPTWGPTPRLRSTRALVVGAAVIGLVAIGGGIAIAVGLAGTSGDLPMPAPTPAPAPIAKPTPHPTPAPKPQAPPPVVAIAPTEITLQVVSDPPGATVVLDGVRLGVAPYTARLPIKHGLGWLKVRKVGRVPIKIHVSLDHDVTWNPRLPARR